MDTRGTPKEVSKMQPSQDPESSLPETKRPIVDWDPKDDVNSLESWHCGTKRMLLTILCVSFPAYSVGNQTHKPILASLAGGDHRVFLNWSKRQALNTEIKIGGKPRLAYGFPPYDNTKDRER